MSNTDQTSAPTPAAGSLQLQVTSDPANLAQVRRSVESFAGEHGLDSNAQGDVRYVALSLN